MKIEVLGTGCAKCDRLEAVARSAADKLAIPYEIAHVRDIAGIVRRGAMITPALAIDGQVVVGGRVPSEAEVVALLTAATDRR